MLNDLGYKASVKAISPNIQFTYIQNTNNKVQISVSQWYQDYPAASDFLNVLFGCDSFHPGSDTPSTSRASATRTIDAQMKEALALGVTDPAGANKLWAEIDKAITDTGAGGAAVHAQACRLPVQARRQLPVQRAVLLA